DQDHPGPDMTGAGRGQGPSDGADGEEPEKCPVCLGTLAGGELAMPDSCCHVFCLRCLLTWAQMSSSCPVDRRPFTNVYRWDGHLGLVQVSSPLTTVLSGSTVVFCPVVFQGVVCAVTCPKGGEKRGSRSSTSKAPTKEPESLPSRRSRRNTKSQEETPSDCKSPAQASLSDSDSSAGQSSKLSKPSPAPTKRKGKRVTNRKASGKRKATRKNSSSPPVSEEEEDGDDNIEKEEQENAIIEDMDMNNSDQLQTAENTLKEESNGCNSADEQVDISSANGVEQNKEVTQEESCEKQQEETAGEEKNDLSCFTDSTQNSPVSTYEESHSQKDEPVSPVSSADSEFDERTLQSPPDSQMSPLEDQASLQSDENTDLDDEMEVCESVEASLPEESSNELKEEMCRDLKESNCPAERESDKNIADEDANTSEDSVGMPESQEYSEVHSSVEQAKEDPTPNEDVVAKEEVLTNSTIQEEGIMKEDSVTLEEAITKENSTVIEKVEKDPTQEGALKKEDFVAQEEVTTKEKFPCKEEAITKENDSPKDDVKSNSDSTQSYDCTNKDNTNVVPMDCSSPTSEPGSSSLQELASDKDCNTDIVTPATAPETQVNKNASSKPQRERERSQERKNGKQRRSRFHSPSSKWSPRRESRRESSRRSRSRERDDMSSSRSSRARSRDRDRERDGDRDYFRRDRSRERRRRRSRSRSRSRSRPERATSREQSPQRKERRGGWKSGHSGSSGYEGRRYQGGSGRFENGVSLESSHDRQTWSENPDWVTEKTRGDAEDRSRDSGFSSGSKWEDQRRGSTGRGGGNRSFYSQQDETPDTRWQPRNNFSGTGNNSGNDSYSRFNENRGGSRKKEPEPGDSMIDRSGWSSASSWAVRRTLPADVQDYYSKRERGGAGTWNRQEEEQQAPVVPGNAPVAVLSVLPPPPPPQLGVLHHPYPLQRPLPVSLQPATPYPIPPQVPIHLHPTVPLLQVPTVTAQGLPPPPPPPPPMQAAGQTVAVAAHKPALLPTPTKVGVATASQVQPAPSQALPSSTTQPGQHSKAQADSSKKEKKQQIQEKAINEVKTAIKPFYQRKEITKEEYKEIVRKAVEKVCHSKSGEVNSSKVANLVKAYVDKYKHARKK
uniref:RING-type domain-containing protein n=1 Tax=Poecilia latipinna TaxID=48699 RepID=A0A3B3VM09_9TELE